MEELSDIGRSSVQPQALGSNSRIRKHKTHTAGEASTLLLSANQMLGEGRSQKDVCAVLGISVMTYHRWRKRASIVWQSSTRAARSLSQLGEQRQQLEMENRMLRRIASDLLLETMKMREAL